MNPLIKAEMISNACSFCVLMVIEYLDSIERDMENMMFEKDMENMMSEKDMENMMFERDIVAIFFFLIYYSLTTYSPCNKSTIQQE